MWRSAPSRPGRSSEISCQAPASGERTSAPTVAVALPGALPLVAGAQPPSATRAAAIPIVIVCMCAASAAREPLVGLGVSRAVDLDARGRLLELAKVVGGERDVDRAEVLLQAMQLR